MKKIRKCFSIVYSTIIILGVGLLFSCGSYKHSKITFQDVTAKSSSDEANIYVHKKDKVYLLKDVEVNEGDAIVGVAEAVEKPVELPDSTYSRKEIKDYAKNHKNDIHVYTYEENDIASNDNHLEVLLEEELSSFEMELSEQNTKKAYTVQKKSELNMAQAIVAAVGVVVLIVGSIFIFRRLRNNDEEEFY